MHLLFSYCADAERRQVEVIHLPTNQRRVFACYNWVDKKCNYVRWLQLDDQATIAGPAKQLPPVPTRSSAPAHREGYSSPRLGAKAQGQQVRHTSSPPRGSPGPGHSGNTRQHMLVSDFEEVLSPTIAARW
jgi:hypothetical protein